MNFAVKKYLSNHEVSSYVALAYFRDMASPLSWLTGNRFLRNHDAKLTSKPKLEGQDLFYCYLAQNMPCIDGPKGT